MKMEKSRPRPRKIGKSSHKKSGNLKLPKMEMCIQKIRIRKSTVGALIMKCGLSKNQKIAK